MNRNFFPVAVIAALALLFNACEKKNVGSDGKVELYLLDSYSKTQNSFRIDESTIKTEATPLISYADFTSYDPDSYTFGLSDKAISSIKSIQHSVHGVPFAIKANDVLIYSGYFWPSYSSAVCDWVVTDPIMVEAQKGMEIKLGYPWPIAGQNIPDRRNDSRITKIFESDKKLR